MPEKKDDEAFGYRQYIDIVRPMKQAWMEVQAMKHMRRKKASPCLDLVDQMYGVIEDSGLKNQFEKDWEELLSKYGYEKLTDRDIIPDDFLHEFKRMMNRYIHKPELGLGLNKRTNSQTDLAPPLRWGDRVRRRKLGGEFVNVDRQGKD